MSRSIRYIALVLVVFGLIVPTAVATQKGRSGPAFNKSAKSGKGASSGSQGRKSGKGGDKTGAGGKSLHNQKPIFQTKTAKSKGPAGPKP